MEGSRKSSIPASIRTERREPQLTTCNSSDNLLLRDTRCGFKGCLDPTNLPHTCTLNSQTMCLFCATRDYGMPEPKLDALYNNGFYRPHISQCRRTFVTRARGTHIKALGMITCPSWLCIYKLDRKLKSLPHCS